MAYQSRSNELKTARVEIDNQLKIALEEHADSKEEERLLTKIVGSLSEAKSALTDVQSDDEMLMKLYEKKRTELYV